MPEVASEKVRRYFDGQAERFDLIYRDEKNLSQKLVDRFFRGVIHRRFALTFESCGPVAGKRVLDIGCGSGRYAVEFARRGAQVVGLDFAPNMVEMARAAAAKVGVADRCQIVQADFLDWTAPQRFDICLAIGFFDYTEEPGPYLKKMRSAVDERAICSFPIRWTLRSPTRWMRLRLSDCPVFFYDRAEVARLFQDTGWNTMTAHQLSRDFLAEARPGNPASRLSNE